MFSMTTFSVLVVLAVLGLVGMAYWMYQEGQEYALQLHKTMQQKIIERNKISAKTSVLESKYQRVLKEQDNLLEQQTQWEQTQTEWGSRLEDLEKENKSLKKELELSEIINSECQVNLQEHEKSLIENQQWQSELEKELQELQHQNRKLKIMSEQNQQKLSEEKKNLEEKVSQFRDDLSKISQEKEEVEQQKFEFINELKEEKQKISSQLSEQIEALQAKFSEARQEKEEVKQQWVHLEQELNRQKQEFEQSQKDWKQEKKELENEIIAQSTEFKNLQQQFYQTLMLNFEKEEQTEALFIYDQNFVSDLRGKCQELEGKVVETEQQYVETKSRLEESLDEILATHRMEIEEESRKTQDLTKKVELLSGELDQSQESLRLKKEALLKGQDDIQDQLNKAQAQVLENEKTLKQLKADNKDLEKQLKQSNKEKISMEKRLKRAHKKGYKADTSDKIVPLFENHVVQLNKVLEEKPSTQILEFNAPEEKVMRKRSSKREEILDEIDNIDEVNSDGLSSFEKKLMSRVLKAQALILNLEEENYRLKKRLKMAKRPAPTSNPELSVLKSKIDEARKSLHLIQAEEEEWDEAA